MLRLPMRQILITMVCQLFNKIFPRDPAHETTFKRHFRFIVDLECHGIIGVALRSFLARKVVEESCTKRANCLRHTVHSQRATIMDLSKAHFLSLLNEEHLKIV